MAFSIHAGLQMQNEKGKCDDTEKHPLYSKYNGEKKACRSEKQKLLLSGGDAGPSCVRDNDLFNGTAI